MIADADDWTCDGSVSMITSKPRTPSVARLGMECAVLAKIFGWWEGATIGTYFTVGRRGEFIGKDQFGNKYYQSRDHISYDGRKRRWVIYDGYADASKVPPEWHGWLHYTLDEPPTEQPLRQHSWEQPYLPNLTGTPMAWVPPGSIAAGGHRPPATGDYEAWVPE
jgi:NADH:ubiquinone oxidoreductase 17.2 kD subunit